MIKYYFIFVLSVLVASFSQIILKRSANIKHKNLIREYFNWWVFVGYVLLFISTILTIVAYSKINYKNGPIIESAGYIFVLILSWICLGESITKKKVLGTTLILLGVLVFYL